MSEVHTKPKTQQLQSGMTLIELMVALAIGAFLMIGAMTVFMQSRTTFRITESVSRLQETARFAIDALEPDVRMAQYWGLVSRSELVLNRRAPTDPAGIGPTTCGNNWTINLNQAVQGSNGSAPWPWAAGCPGSVPVETNSDTLVVRHAGDDVVTPANTAGQLAIVSSRFNGTLYDVATTPAGYDVAGGRAEIHRLMVSGYYVRRATATAQPALVRKVLGTNGVITNEEVIAGVEDMQVQFGVDMDSPGGLSRGSADRYVNPNDPIIDPTNAGYVPNAEILAVRIWLRVRAERVENGFTDTATYVYADQNVGPFNDGFRRMVVSKTIYLRNNRPPDY
ncbi:MAG: PilW family protein [Gammaproteobacteria bacterium]